VSDLAVEESDLSASGLNSLFMFSSSRGFLDDDPAVLDDLCVE
jgi:hypothetical protein